MGFFETVGKEGKKQEEMNKATKEINDLIGERNKLLNELKNIPSYQQELLEKGEEAFSSFITYFESNHFKVDQVDPVADVKKMEAKSGEFKFSLTQKREKHLIFEADVLQNRINLADKNHLRLNFNGYVDNGRVFVQGLDYLEDPAILQSAKQDLEGDIRKIKALIDEAYTPELVFRDDNEVEFETINRYLDNVQITLEKYFNR